MTEGILVGPEMLRQRFIDDDGTWGVLNVAVVEGASAHYRNSHGFEISGGNRNIQGGNERFAGLHLIALSEDDAVVVVVTERHGFGGPRVRNAGDRAQGGECATHEVAHLYVFRIFCARQGHGGGHDAVGFESGIDVEERSKTREQEAGADQEHKGESDLRGDEELTNTARLFARCAGTAIFM